MSIFSKFFQKKQIAKPTKIEKKKVFNPFQKKSKQPQDKGCIDTYIGK